MRLISFLIPILIFSCTAPASNTNIDVGIELCNILCVVHEKYPFQVSDKYEKVVIINEMNYNSKYLGNRIKFSVYDGGLSCPCMDIYLLSKDKDIYSGEYGNVVHKLGFSTYTDNSNELKFTKTICSDLTNFDYPLRREHGVSVLKHDMYKTEKDWIINGEPYIWDDIEPKKRSSNSH